MPSWYDVLSDGCLLAQRFAGQNRPAVAQIEHLVHLIEEIRVL
jgi:hypothetical protein